MAPSVTCARARSLAATWPPERIARRGAVVRRHARSHRLVDLAFESRGLRGRDGIVEEITVELLSPNHALLNDLLVTDGPCESYDVDDDRQERGGLVHVACSVNYGTSTTDAARAMRAVFARLPSRLRDQDVAFARRADIAWTASNQTSLADEASHRQQTVLRKMSGLFLTWQYAGVR